ncbi:MAG: metallophosphoesterase [Peptococcaceae bacterium]|nr:metallophosphoesterase [Peptococcaceae bacterium]
MKIGLISDTHRFLANAYLALDKMGKIDLLIHAGDHYRDAMEIASQINIPVYGVIGNCDYLSEGPMEELIELEGILIFVTHGHRYQVKSSKEKLYRRGLELGARVIVYGHTHIAQIEKRFEPGSPVKNELLLINPGSLAAVEGGPGISYGLLDIHGGEINSQIVYF